MHTIINVFIQHENIKWDEAPPWANFYAVDVDGDRWWYKNKLTFHEAKTKYPTTKYNWILMKDKD